VPPRTEVREVKAPVAASKVHPGNGSAWGLSSRLACLVFGHSGTGKTTFWSTFPGPILAFVCSGSDNPDELMSIDTPELRGKIRAEIVKETQSVPDTLRAIGGKFKTVVLDHITSYQDLALREVLGVKELPAQKHWKMAEQKQWGVCTAMCKDTVRDLLAMTCNVVVVAQERVFGKEEGIPVDVAQPWIGPAATPSLADYLRPTFPYVLNTFIREESKEEVIEQDGVSVTTTVPTGEIEFAMRIGPHQCYGTKFRSPRRDLPKTIVNPTYDTIMRLRQPK
jgi:hypothetical protein